MSPPARSPRTSQGSRIAPQYGARIARDLGCGAITVKLRRDADAASWCDWGFQNNYDETITGIDQLRG